MATAVSKESVKAPAASSAGLRLRSALMLAGLLAVSLADNHFRFRLFPGVGFAFGSAAMLITVNVFGLGWGALAGLLAGSYTYFRWHHPYNMVTLAGEALFVGLCLRRRGGRNIVVVDGIYWLLIGMPWVWLVYSQVLQIGGTAFLHVLGSGINGMMNALIAWLITALVPVRRWAGRSTGADTFSLQQIVFNLFLAFMLVPSLLLTVNTIRDEFVTYELVLRNQTEAVSSQMARSIRMWYRVHQGALTGLAETAAGSGLASPEVQLNAGLLYKSLPSFLYVVVVDARGNLAATVPDLRLLAGEPEPRVSGAALEVPITVHGEVLGFIRGGLDAAAIRQKFAEREDKQIQVTLLDQDQRVLASTRSDLSVLQVYGVQNPEVRSLWGTMYQWLLEAGSPQVQRKIPVYVQRVSIDWSIPWTLVMESPVSDYYNRLYRTLTSTVSIALLLSTLALILSAVLSRGLARPLSQLAEITTNLPSKFSGEQPIPWPATGIAEIASLVTNFQSMAGALKQHVQAVQQDAREQRALPAAALEATDTSVMITDPARRIVYANRQFYLYYGYTPDEVIGRTPAILHGPGTDANVVRSVQAAMAKGSPIRVELTNYRKNGSPVEVEVTISPISGEVGEPAFWVSVGRDISERKAVERMKDGFISTVSHELRTPLTAIHGALTLLDETMAHKLDERAAKLLSIADRNTDRMVRLVNDILILERIESGRVNLHLQTFPADLLVQQSLAVVRTLADQASVGLAIEADPVQVVTDPDKAVDILVNLLTNAVKFSEPGTTITVRVEQAEGEVIFAVCDQGRGIPHTHLERIFDRFEQVDASDSRLKGGTGLGLTIARASVEEMGGRMWVESEVGHGSRFFFTLKAAP